MKFAGIGDNVVDRYIDDRIMFPGGNAVNFAVYVSELGQDSAYMGVFTDDKESLLIQDSLRKKGVDISHCFFKKGYGTERCDVKLMDGDRVFVGCNTGGLEHSSFDLDTESLNILKKYDVIHCGCYAEMENEFEKLKNHKAIKTFDFSEEDEYKTDDYLGKICPYIDLALFSASGKTKTYMEKLKNKCFDLGTSMILMTRGGEGQTLFTKKQSYEGMVKNVEPVDTMGAGDAFFAAFIVSLMEKGWEKNVDPTDWAIMASFEKAADFSAANCLREGAFGFPTKY